MKRTHFQLSNWFYFLLRKFRNFIHTHNHRAKTHRKRYLRPEPLSKLNTELNSIKEKHNSETQLVCSKNRLLKNAKAETQKSFTESQPFILRQKNLRALKFKIKKQKKKKRISWDEPGHQQQQQKEELPREKRRCCCHHPHSHRAPCKPSEFGSPAQSSSPWSSSSSTKP